MLVCGTMIGVCSIFGLPWCVAATVLCLGHIDSLKMETETSAPGERPQFLGVREQRVTGVMVFVLTGLSVKLAPILKVCIQKRSHSRKLNMARIIQKMILVYKLMFFVV